MKKTVLSSILGAFLGLLIIAPPIDYSIPLFVNTFHWLYLICAAGLFGFFLLSCRLNTLLKALSVFLFASCFFSQAPAYSFNAYVLVIFSLYLLLVYQKADFNIVIRFIEAAFWFQVCLGIFQMIGMDKLLQFDHAFQLDGTTLQAVGGDPSIQKFVMFGTVMQYMRFSSVILCMAPFLIFKSRWYVIPIFIMCLISRSSTFALSLIAGIGIYLFLVSKYFKKQIVIAAVLLAVAYAFYDFGSWGGAIVPSNGGRLISWVAVIKTWIFDLSKATPSSIWNMNGPFNYQWFLTGHGMDTFLTLFPFYKHDMNPFPQAHNDWLQMFWEIGIVGAGLFMAYVADLFRRLFVHKQYFLIAGLVMISLNRFFAFPDRMTQTMFLMVAYAALCEKSVQNG